MKLYHGTQDWRITNIMREGLKPNNIGIIYLAPSIEESRQWGDGTVLEVETGDLHLTAFDDCKEWEILCWTQKPIAPDKLKEI
jgi:RNA:NAD 2'-phosphotransferase (TPT1/KptA family)